MNAGFYSPILNMFRVRVSGVFNGLLRMLVGLSQPVPRIFVPFR
jgi:hypothetical protein